MPLLDHFHPPSLLLQMGDHSAEVLVVQAGVEYPETVTILTQDSRP